MPVKQVYGDREVQDSERDAGSGGDGEEEEGDAAGEADEQLAAWGICGRCQCLVCQCRFFQHFFFILYTCKTSFYIINIYTYIYYFFCIFCMFFVFEGEEVERLAEWGMCRQRFFSSCQMSKAGLVRVKCLSWFSSRQKCQEHLGGASV